jgi:hypothetical protein
MSLWPDGDVKEDFGSWASLTGVPASLHYHQNYDCYLERGNREESRKPLVFTLDNFSDRNLNEAYEIVLEYNDITPDKVTLTEGKDKVSKGEYPAISLPKTLWGLHADMNQGENFYKYTQSCTGFVLSLLSFNDDNASRYIYSNLPLLRRPYNRGTEFLLNQEHYPRDGFISVIRCKETIQKLQQGYHNNVPEGNCLVS